MTNDKTQETEEVEKVKKANQRMYDNRRDHLNTLNMKNMEAFDKAMITLSSAGLALSLSFSKLFITVSNESSIYLLKISWWCFILVIIMTVLSFLTAIAANEKERILSRKYYIEMGPDYDDKDNSALMWSKRLTKCSAILFVVAVLLSAIFVSSSVDNSVRLAKMQKEKEMAKKTKSVKAIKGLTAPQKEPRKTVPESKPAKPVASKNDSSKK